MHWQPFQVGALERESMTIYDAPKVNSAITALSDYASILEAFRSGKVPYRTLAVYEQNIIEQGLSAVDINMVRNTFRA